MKVGAKLLKKKQITSFIEKKHYSEVIKKLKHAVSCTFHAKIQ